MRATPAPGPSGTARHARRGPAGSLAQGPRLWWQLLLLLCLGALWAPAEARSLPLLQPLWSAQEGPAQSPEASAWLERLRQDLAAAPAICPPTAMPPLDANRTAQAFHLRRPAEASGPAIVYLQDPVASTFVVVRRSALGCPSVYVGGRWHAFGQREYLSPYPNMRVSAWDSDTELEVVIQDARVMRPWVRLAPETDFRRANLLLWMLLAALVAVLLNVIVLVGNMAHGNRTVLAYGVYVGAFLWWIVQEFGMAAAWLPALFPPAVFVPVQCVSVAVVILAIGWTMVEFLGLKGWARALIGGGQILSACIFLAAMVWPPGYRLGSLILGLNALPTMLLLLMHSRDSELPKRLFAGGFAVTMVGGGVQSLSVAFGISEANHYAVYSYTVGGFIQVLFWLGAITIRLKSERAQEALWRKQELEQQVTQATAQLLLEKQVAEEATRAKSAFLAAASHDLRQPTHALGMLIARLGQFPMEAGMRQVQHSLEASAHAMQDLLDGLMDYSRLDASAQRVDLRHVSLHQVLGDLQTSLAPLAAEKRLRLRIRPSALWVLSDPLMLQRMVMNLALNAVRYTEQGSILVAARVQPSRGQVAIEIWDSGIGIATEHHEDIFKEFYQIGNPGRDRKQGMGLGLSIVQRSAQLLGHGIALRSHPGCGSRFSILLPQALEPTPLAQEVAQELWTSISLAGLVVLLLEDDELSRHAVSELLSSWGCTVLSVATGAEARALMQQGAQPEIILSDYRLGHAQSGIEVVAELRSIAGRRIPSCLLSGDMDATLVSDIEVHAMGLLHKPVRPAKLRNMIRRLVASA